MKMERGYYRPSFYKLVVNTVYDLADLNELKRHPQPFSTFFHEYLHYLQDITTSFGLMNGLEVQNRIKFYNNYSRKQKGTFKIPISKGLNFHIENSHEMNHVYLGPVENETIHKIAYVRKINSAVRVRDPYNTNLAKIVVGLENIDGSNKDIDFGGYSIVESMAHIGQKQCYGQIQHASVPYEMAQYVAMHIFPEFGTNELNVFALCDVSLMTYHPGYCFYEFLQGIKCDGILPKAPEEVYSLFYTRMSANGKTIMEQFCEVIKEAKIKLCEYLTSDGFKNEKLWLETILERSKQLRLERPYFMLELIKQQKVNSYYLHGLIKELGSPLIQNDISESHIFLPSGFEDLPIRIEMFAYIGEIFTVFDSGKTTCELRKFCKQSERGDITDSRCLEEPWERSRDTEVCGFGLFWRMWGLENCRPKNAKF